MNTILISIAAAAPFALLLYLISFRRWSTLYAISSAWILTVLLTLLIWRLSPVWIAASFVKAIFVSIELLLILFTAVFMLMLLKERGQIDRIHAILVSISPDVRIQALIIAWLFGSLIEGVAGFGTPAALAAPLLVSLGFSPIISVVIALVANSTAVSFGAAGTPILIGLGALGFPQETISSITQTTALFHMLAGIIIPLSIVYLVIVNSNQKTGKLKRFFEIVPFAILSWASFVVPYYLTSVFIGPELPSIIGGVIGLTITSLFAHYRILTPRHVLTFKSSMKKEKPVTLKNYEALIPYGVVVLFLALSRTIPEIKSLLTHFSISFQSIFGANLTYTFIPFYTPSFAFLLGALTTIILFKERKKNVKNAFLITARKMKVPALSILFALAFVQILLVSQNSELLPSIPLVLANSAVYLTSKGYLFIAPFIGAFGAFVVGSNTLSNLLFAALQSESARALSYPVVLILSLQVIGGAIGNMIAIHNILAASATVGLKNKELEIIKHTVLIALIYILLVSILAVIYLIIN